MTANGNNCAKVLAVRREGCIQRPCPGDEKLHRAVSEENVWLLLMRARHIQRRDAIDELALDPQDLAAGHHNRSGRTQTHYRFRQSSHRVDDVFAIVQNQENFLSSDGANDGLSANCVAAQPQAEDARDRGWDETRIRQRGHIH